MTKLQLTVCLLCLSTARADDLLFEDALAARPANDWSWREEVQATQRPTAHGLQIRSMPGNIWGGTRDLKTWLLRPLPSSETIRTEVTVSASPKLEYEQAGLLWHVDDGNYVKCMQEWLQGKLVVNFVREEKETPQIVATVPIESNTVHLRLTKTGGRIVAEYRTADTGPWQTVGSCSPLASAPTHVGIGTMQGESQSDRWATFSQFRITAPK